MQFYIAQTSDPEGKAKHGDCPLGQPLTVAHLLPYVQPRWRKAVLAIEPGSRLKDVPVSLSSHAPDVRMEVYACP